MWHRMHKRYVHMKRIFETVSERGKYKVQKRIYSWVYCETIGRKGKLPLCLSKYHGLKTYWGNGGIAPRILNPGTRWGWVIIFTPLSTDIKLKYLKSTNLVKASSTNLPDIHEPNTGTRHFNGYFLLARICHAVIKIPLGLSTTQWRQVEAWRQSPRNSTPYYQMTVSRR
jgi:hypothetical protein